MLSMYEHAMARYGLAVATTIVATALSLAVRPLVHATPSPPFIVSVLLTAWLGGIGPALLATLLAAVSLDLVTAPRLQALSVSEEAITRVVVFVIVAIAVGAMAAARRRAEQTTQIARAEAEAANRQKDEFVSMLAHELRTPLTVILSAANAVADSRLDPDGTARALAAIQPNTRLQARLIGDPVDLARIGRGKVSLDERDVNLREIVESGGRGRFGDSPGS